MMFPTVGVPPEKSIKSGPALRVGVGTGGTGDIEKGGGDFGNGMAGLRSGRFREQRNVGWVVGPKNVGRRHFFRKE